MKERRRCCPFLRHRKMHTLPTAPFISYHGSPCTRHLLNRGLSHGTSSPEPPAPTTNRPETGSCTQKQPALPASRITQSKRSESTRVSSIEALSLPRCPKRISNSCRKKNICAVTRQSMQWTAQGTTPSNRKRCIQLYHFSKKTMLVRRLQEALL